MRTQREGCCLQDGRRGLPGSRTELAGTEILEFPPETEHIVTKDRGGHHLIKAEKLVKMPFLLK